MVKYSQPSILTTSTSSPYMPILCGVGLDTTVGSSQDANTIKAIALSKIVFIVLVV
jgi:hypothetical protein